MQIFGVFICTQSALHVSGDVFAHHQEHLTVFTAAAGWCHGRDGPSSISSMTPAGSNVGGLYQKL